MIIIQQTTLWVDERDMLVATRPLPAPERRQVSDFWAVLTLSLVVGYILLVLA